MEIDPFIDFEDVTYPNPPINFIYEFEDYSYLNVPKNYIRKDLINFTIKLDITIENTSYNQSGGDFYMGGAPTLAFTGLLSTEWTNKWLSYYVPLYKTTLILKYFFHQKGFNNTYNGKNIESN